MESNRTEEKKTFHNLQSDLIHIKTTVSVAQFLEGKKKAEVTSTKPLFNVQ